MNDTPTPEPETQMRITDWLREHPRRQYHDAANYIDSLERERDSLEDQRDFARNMIRVLERERDEAQNEILGWKNKWDCAIEMGARAECERDEMTLRRNLAISLLDEECALADRLARTLKRWSNNDQANRDLAAWKEARK